MGLPLPPLRCCCGVQRILQRSRACLMGLPIPPHPTLRCYCGVQRGLQRSRTCLITAASFTPLRCCCGVPRGPQRSRRGCGPRLCAGTPTSLWRGESGAWEERGGGGAGGRQYWPRYRMCGVHPPPTVHTFPSLRYGSLLAPSQRLRILEGVQSVSQHVTRLMGSKH